jgi:uncharacterized membrane protein YfcA
MDLAVLGPLVLLAVIGLVASVINTMAGGGGLLVLPVLIALGVPPSVANGTTRLGVLAQNITSVVAFRHGGFGDAKLVLRLAPAMIVGAAIGAFAATRLSDEILRPLFGAVLLAWAIILVVRPGPFSVANATVETGFSHPVEPRAPGWGSQVAAVGIGVYGGFLQAGVGFPLLALLVTALGHEPVRANAIKVALVLAFTLVSLPMFAAAGQVAWREAIALAVGAAFGGWLGAAWQVRSGATVVRWVVVIAVAVSGIAMVVGW